MAIRNSPEVTGVKIGKMEHKLSLFADDIVLFLTNLEKSVPSVDNILQSFGQFSGYKVNQKKSSLLLLNKSNSPIQTNLTITYEGFPYLGIQVNPDITKIIPTKYDPLVKKVLDSLEKWNMMPISMIGRINIIKMAILPKFLYLFQSIPLHIPLSFFSIIE